MSASAFGKTMLAAVDEASCMEFAGQYGGFEFGLDGDGKIALIAEFDTAAAHDELVIIGEGGIDGREVVREDFAIVIREGKNKAGGGANSGIAGIGEAGQCLVDQMGLDGRRGRPFAKDIRRVVRGPVVHEYEFQTQMVCLPRGGCNRIQAVQ